MSGTITVVDYGAGNLASVRLAFERLGSKVLVTSDPAAVLDAERVVFPGVGAIGTAMKRLNDLQLADALRDVVARGTAFLGICLGTQIIFERSEEDGGTEGLGILPGRVQMFQAGPSGAKVPQIGWNGVRFARPHPVFEGIRSGAEFYFVHSYYPVPADRRHVLAETDYAGATIASVVGRRNLVATQFHPERSGRIGLELLENFRRWDGNE
jgi:imidazole glycerol-phosphate synthase subunit HisH